MQKVASIVVTYNRKAILLENLKMQFEQDESIVIYIIDNASNDGTKDYLEEQGILSLKNIYYFNTGTNLGGAGGFEFGLKKAYDAGYNWFLLMDDDGRPFDKNCFKNLFARIASMNYQHENKILLNSVVLCNENELTFTLGNHIEEFDKFLESDFCQNGIVKDHVNPFNGTLISRGLVDAIGFPNGDFFIRGDEIDYDLRAKLAGAVRETVLSSRYYHPKAGGMKYKKIFGTETYLSIEAPWKEYYIVRNYTFSVLSNISNRRQALKKARMHYLKHLYCAITMKCKKIKTIKMINKGYRDGKKGRLGATVQP